jgi:hypothetical protein
VVIELDWQAVNKDFLGRVAGLLTEHVLAR